MLWLALLGSTTALAIGMGFFILGLLAGRLRLFEKLEKYKNQIYRLAWMALGAVILLYIIKPILP
ncbi:MAG: hypothetical protein RSF79_27115, partial [Janthinobacterium sp.]